MPKIAALLFAVAAVTLASAGTASAAPSATAALCRAADKATIISKAHCRVVRRCGQFGCSYEEVCN